MIDDIDLTLLSVLTTRAGYNQHHRHIKKGMCIPESWTLVQDIGKYYEAFPTVNEVDHTSFVVWYRTTAHPDWKMEKLAEYSTILDNVLKHKAPANVLTILNRTAAVADLQQSLDDLNANKLQWDDFRTKVTRALDDADDARVSKVINLSFKDMPDRSGTGYYWRVEDLNKSVGPVAGGDVIIIAKRPEIGGTSFITSEMTFMLDQMGPDGRVCLFNNEEEPTKLWGRVGGCALNINYRDLMADKDKADELMDQWLNGRKFHIVQDTHMSLASIHNELRIAEIPYKVIAINVLLKVDGTGKMEDHDKLQSLGEELRRIALDYNVVVLAVVQAGDSADGIRWPTLAHIYKSRTALQGEADVLLFIGKGEDDPPSIRGLHVAKNKIPPAPCVDTSLKHIKCEVRFDIDTGRFESINFRKHSYAK